VVFRAISVQVVHVVAPRSKQSRADCSRPSTATESGGQENAVKTAGSDIAESRACPLKSWAEQRRSILFGGPILDPHIQKNRTEMRVPSISFRSLAYNTFQYFPTLLRLISRHSLNQNTCISGAAGKRTVRCSQLFFAPNLNAVLNIRFLR